MPWCRRGRFPHLPQNPARLGCHGNVVPPAPIPPCPHHRVCPLVHTGITGDICPRLLGKLRHSWGGSLTVVPPPGAATHRVPLSLGRDGGARPRGGPPCPPVLAASPPSQPAQGSRCPRMWGPGAGSGDSVSPVVPLHTCPLWDTWCGGAGVLPCPQPDSGGPCPWVSTVGTPAGPGDPGGQGMDRDVGPWRGTGGGGTWRGWHCPWGTATLSCPHPCPHRCPCHRWLAVPPVPAATVTIATATTAATAATMATAAIRATRRPHGNGLPVPHPSRDPPRNAGPGVPHPTETPPARPPQHPHPWPGGAERRWGPPGVGVHPPVLSHGGRSVGVLSHGWEPGAGRGTGGALSPCPPQGRFLGGPALRQALHRP